MSTTPKTSKWTVENLVRGAANIDRWKAETDFLVRKILAIMRESEGLEKFLSRLDNYFVVQAKNNCEWQMKRRHGELHIRCVWNRANVNEVSQLAYSTDPSWGGLETMGVGGIQFARSGLQDFVDWVLECDHIPEMENKLAAYATAGKS